MEEIKKILIKVLKFMYTDKIIIRKVSLTSLKVISADILSMVSEKVILKTSK